MTIKIPYRGIIEIVGGHDTGKTIAALQTVNNTKDIVFVDDDLKGDGTVKQMKEQGMEFDSYINLAEARMELSNTPKPDELLKLALDTIDMIAQKKHKVIIFDTWRIVYEAARGHVERNKPRYSDVIEWRGNSIIIQGLVSKVARMIERQQLSKLKAVCDLLIITHHLKDNYISNVVVGDIPESSKNFQEICNMRLWLRRNMQSKVPVILFLKRPNLPTKDMRFIDIVPPKITPNRKHQSIWEAIKDYENNPVEGRELRQDETPTAEELSAIQGTIAPEMIAYVRQIMEYQKSIGASLSETLVTDSSAVDSFSKKIITDVKQGDYPANGIVMIASASAKFGFDFDKVKEILGRDEVINSYSEKDWDKLVAASENGQAEKTKKKAK